MKTPLVCGLVLVLLISCDPIMLKVATQAEVTAYAANANGRLPAPGLSLPSGSYSSDQRLSLTSTVAAVSFRYTTNGTEPSSGGGGTLYTGPIVLPSNDTSVVKAVGFKSGWVDSPVVSATYTSSPVGTLDQGFGSFGYQTNMFTTATAVGIQSNGDIVVAGNSYSNGYLSSSLVRERLDSFGVLANSGTNWLEYNQYSTARALVVQPDDKVLVAGSYNPTSDATQVLSANTQGQWTIFRLQSDGLTFDKYFDNPSVAWLVPSEALTVARQFDGKVVAAGVNGGLLAVARYNSDGTLDSGFGTAGVLQTTLTSTPASVLVQSDSEILVVGLGTSSSGYSNDAVALVRVSPAGVLDNTFGTGGVVFVGLPVDHSTKNFTVGSATVSGAALQSDGKIVFVGTPWALPTSNHTWLVGRVLPNGALDTSFGGSGSSGLAQAVIPLANGSTPNVLQFDLPRAVAIASDDKIVVAGTTQFLDGSALPQGYQVDLVRYSASGRLDLTFNAASGSPGMALSATGALASAWNAVAIQPNGQIVVTGFGRLATGQALRTARFW